MGPQARLSGLEAGSVISVRPDLKERLMSGSGSPGRLGPDNVSRDSGIGCLKVSVPWTRVSLFYVVSKIQSSGI